MSNFAEMNRTFDKAQNYRSGAIDALLLRCGLVRTNDRTDLDMLAFSKLYSNEASQGPSTKNTGEEAPYAEGNPSSPATWSEKLVRMLGRLQDGWDGENSVAPNDDIVRDIECLIGCFPGGTAEPEFEVDPEDGYVTLRWMTHDLDTGFALVFNGKQSVVGVHSSDQDNTAKSWKIRIFAERKIADALESPDVLKIIAHK